MSTTGGDLSRGGDTAAQSPPQDTRLSEQEQKLVARLLSDPTYFPIEFRTWIKNYLEGSGIVLPSSAIQGGGGVGPRTELPPGLIIPVAASSALPPDVLICDGRAVLRSDYLNLWNAIGTTWGAGDGTTTFNLPDYRDRALYGQGGKISLGQGGTDGVAYGSRGGPDHSHSFGQTSGAAGGHSHSLSMNSVGDHNHGPGGLSAYAVGGWSQAALGSGGTTRYIVGDFAGATAAAGGHTPSGSVGSVGDHTHFVSGNTSGGFALNHGSYAGVLYGITTG